MASDPFTQFVQLYLKADVADLVLKFAGKKTDIDVKEAAIQIAALQKIQQKVPEWYRLDIRFPSVLATEQCSSQATAVYKSRFAQNKTVLDLSGGLGIDTYYFTKMAKSVTYVEPQRVLVQYAERNFKTLAATNITCVESTAEVFLATNTTHFDLIYLDPDRRTASGKRVFGFHDSSPDVITLLESLLKQGSAVLIKASPMLDISLACKQLQRVAYVEVIGYQDECKELLFYIEAQENTTTPTLAAIEIDHAGAETMRVEKTENTAISFAQPLAFVYDPPASLLKSGCFHEFAAQYGLKKLHPDTHLFTSETLVANVPGRTFALSKTCSVQADEVGAYLPKARKANLRAVNFPDDTETIKRRLKIKDGGDVYLFAVTLIDGSLAVLVCHKV
jgi:16S rRNA G966 N2-methylase RsmD